MPAMELTVTYGLKSPLGHVRLCKDDRTGGTQTRNHGRITLWNKALHRERAARGLESLRVVVVLDEHRNASKRRQLMRCLKISIASVGFGQSVFIDYDDRVQPQSVDGLLIV